MLKSLCIKTNNTNIINYLLCELNNINLDNVYVSKSKFKNYKNIIIHYKGFNIKNFIDIISVILSYTIMKFYEEKLLKHIIKSSYFYFSELEQSEIKKICKENLSSSENYSFIVRKETIVNSLNDYFQNNKSLVLDGFVNFRLKKYINILDSIVDSSVNKFVIDREYLEFIDLLKTYVNSKNARS